METTMFGTMHAAWGLGTLLTFFFSLQVAHAQTGLQLTLPAKVNAIAGEDVVIPATYTTTRQLNLIEWIKRDDDQKATQVYTYNPLLGNSKSYGQFAGRARIEDQASLRIMRATSSDAGRYFLKIMTDDLGTEEAITELVVLVPPEVKVGPPGPLVITSGKSVTLKCTVFNGRPNNITSLWWEKDNMPIEHLRLDGMKYSGGSMKVPALVVRFVDRMDAGRYTCVVRHPASSRPLKASLTLKVLYPPSVTRISESLIAEADDMLTLECIADGYPLPNVTWTRDGVRLPCKPQNLPHNLRACSQIFEVLRMNDTGSYKCSATNGIGDGDSKALFVTVRPPTKGLDMFTIAIATGVLVGCLWLGLCLVLLGCYIRKRQHEKERNKFAFYYNLIGRGEGAIEDKTAAAASTTDGPKPPDKPKMSPLNTGIGTLRKNKKGQDRRFARVLYPYSPTDENELQLDIDDVIEVLEGENGGWCLGYLKGRIGLFPSNYAVFLPTTEAKKAVAAQLTNIEGKGKLSI
ncbi:PREDICTED: protein amalgam-like [Branchiostoma belcheri]|uniref:Protein amalgam-like n=1 Tax=Branchiostoma belcheri TaxID=7741 RepID=A0A6P4ZV41_BRABE|nr:PREDICTED: protein amalgam-like [Branchiostoma belcheri]